jgi:hypothetical protein
MGRLGWVMGRLGWVTGRLGWAMGWAVAAAIHAGKQVQMSRERHMAMHQHDTFGVSLNH